MENVNERFPHPNTGLEEPCGCIYAPGLGGHIRTHCREDHNALPRTLEVKGWLVRHQVRQHLKLAGIPYTEDEGRWGSVFRFDATEQEWVELQDYVKEVTP